MFFCLSFGSWKFFQTFNSSLAALLLTELLLRTLAASMVFLVANEPPPGIGLWNLITFFTPPLETEASGDCKREIEVGTT